MNAAWCPRSRHERCLFFDPHMALLRCAIWHETHTEDLYHTRDADSVAYMGENDAQYVTAGFRAKRASRLPRHDARRIVRVTSPRRDVDHALVARD